MTQLCDVCDEKHQAVMACPTCQEHLCDVAAKQHTKQKATREHQLVAVLVPKQLAEEHAREPTGGDRPGGDRTGDLDRRGTRGCPEEPVRSVCLQHGQPHSFFDVRCNRAVCRDCVVLEHQGHQCVSLPEGRRRVLRKLEQVQVNADAALLALREDETAQRTKLARLDFLFHQKEVQLKMSFNQVSASVCVCVCVCEGGEKDKEAIVTHQKASATVSNCFLSFFNRCMQSLGFAEMPCDKPCPTSERRP
jgi:hypothetical protein